MPSVLLHPVERRYRDALSWVRANARESDRRLYARMTEEERLTFRLRHTPGWPGPDPQPRGLFQLLWNGAHAEHFPKSARKVCQ